MAEKFLSKPIPKEYRRGDVGLMRLKTVLQTYMEHRSALGIPAALEDRPSLAPRSLEGAPYSRNPEIRRTVSEHVGSVFGTEESE
jgi:hypothetical protein